MDSLVFPQIANLDHTSYLPISSKHKLYQSTYIHMHVSRIFFRPKTDFMLDEQVKQMLKENHI